MEVTPRANALFFVRASTDGRTTRIPRLGGEGGAHARSLTRDLSLTEAQSRSVDSWNGQATALRRLVEPEGSVFPACVRTPTPIKHAHRIDERAR